MSEEIELALLLKIFEKLIGYRVVSMPHVLIHFFTLKNHSLKITHERRVVKFLQNQDRNFKLNGDKKRIKNVENVCNCEFCNL
jgi:hypothetical protein